MLNFIRNLLKLNNRYIQDYQQEVLKQKINTDIRLNIVNQTIMNKLESIDGVFILRNISGIPCGYTMGG